MVYGFILWGYGLEEGVIEGLDNGMSVSILKGVIDEARSLVDGIWVYILGGYGLEEGLDRGIG